MIPLRVTAEIVGAMVNPGNRIALDALLGYAVCVRDNIAPAVTVDEMVAIEIPVARSECGRFHLASFSEQVVESRELRHLNKRPVIAEMQALGSSKIGRVQISAGPNKGYRIPLEAGHLEGDLLTWWCVGDEGEVRALLGLVHYLGKRRAAGSGKVARWLVELCEPWGDGFPVVRDGRALRPLPVDYPGVIERNRAIGALTYPYWLRETYQEVLLP